MRNDSILRRLRKLILQIMHCADGTLKTGKNMVVLGQTRTPSMASFDVQSLSQDKRWSLPQFVIIPVRILTFSLLSYCFQTIASNRRNRYLTGSLMLALHCYNQSELKSSIYNLAALKASFPSWTLSFTWTDFTVCLEHLLKVESFENDSIYDFKLANTD